jgi:2-polyprenyl-3-methyl-5-hydroxy-6-metoxy-1,4-benzoquinol methylase
MATSAIHYLKCPLCQHASIAEAFTSRDFSISQETFAIWACPSCSVRFTQNAPDESEMARYYRSDNYISHSDTSKGLVNRVYKLARRFTLRAKRRQMEQISGRRQGQMLDIGCGTGAFLHTMQQAGWEVTGLEPDSGARNKARQLYDLDVGDIGQLSQLPAGRYHLITLWHVLEHIYDLHGAFFHIHRLLAPGGKLIVAVPNYLSTDAAQYGPHWAAWDLPRHLYHFSPQSIRCLAGIHGMAVMRVYPMWLDAYYIALLSEKYRGKGLVWPRAAWAGLRSSAATLWKREKASSLVYVIGVL